MVGSLLATALAGIGYSALFVPHALALPPALESEQRELNGCAGRLNYYVAGPVAKHGAVPLLLIHSVNAAASSYELRPLFEHYQESRRVYALDLPGFGFSDRSPRDYTPRLYTNAILDALDEIAREAGSMPVDVVALSLGGEFAARAASERAARFNTLALVTPTGFGAGQQFYGEPGSTRGFAATRRLFEFPLWGQALFDLLNSRVSQRYFLKQSFGSYEAIDRGLLEYDYLTAHQPGARHAPYAFVSGTLFSADISRVYEKLDLPVWLAYGTRGEFSDFSGTGNVAARGNWTIQSFETGSIPYFERPQEFIAAYQRFLDQAAEARRQST
jgi:pimeloyl-ACP methyl ester carboxylesterase